MWPIYFGRVDMPSCYLKRVTVKRSLLEFVFDGNQMFSFLGQKTCVNKSIVALIILRVIFQLGPKSLGYNCEFSISLDRFVIHLNRCFST